MSKGRSYQRCIQVFMLAGALLLFGGCPQYRFFPEGNLLNSAGEPLDYDITAEVYSVHHIHEEIYIPVSTEITLHVNTLDWDRVDSRYFIAYDEWDTGEWTPWREGKMKDDVSTGKDERDYHIRWEATGGQLKSKFGSSVTFKAPDPDGTPIDNVVITAIIDDIQRGNEEKETLGSPDDEALRVSITIHVWEATITARRSDEWKETNDTDLYKELCSAGGKRLGKVNQGERCNGCSNSMCLDEDDQAVADGFYDNIEFTAHIPAEVPEAYSTYKFFQEIRGTIKATSRSTGQEEVIRNKPDWEPDTPALYGDSSTKSPVENQEDVNEVYALDTPGYVTKCTNDKEVDDYMTHRRSHQFRTTCYFEGEEVSLPFEWEDSQYLEVNESTGTWERAGN